MIKQLPWFFNVSPFLAQLILKQNRIFANEQK